MIRYDITPDTDSIDIKIIEELTKNSKITCKELSNRVNLSIPRVYERVKRLEERAVIEGYHAKVDLKKLGYGIHAFILVKTDKYVGDMFHTLKEMEYVHDLWVLSGEYHYMLEVYVKDIGNLNNLAADLYSRIGRTQTVLVMEH